MSSSKVEADRSSPGGRPRLRALAVKLALAAGASLAALVVAELVVRATLPAMGEHGKLLCEFDDVLGWRKVALTSGRFTTDEYDVVETINSKGLRGPEYDYESGSAYRILVLGDSFVEGYTVQAEELFTRVLERELDAAGGRDFEVINGGTGGYSTDQELLFYIREGSKYDPDLVVLMFYDNDIYYNAQSRYWRGEKPLYSLEADGTLRLTNVPLSPPAEDAAGPRDLKALLREHSQLYCYVREALKGNAGLHAALVELGLMSPSDEESTQSAPVEFRIYGRGRRADEIERCWDTTKALIAKLKEAVAARGSRLLVAYVPSSYAVDDEERAAFARRYGEELDVTRTASDLGAVCRELGIEFEDPSAAITASSETLYFEHDGHWNTAGHRVAGELLARRISTICGE